MIKKYNRLKVIILGSILFELLLLFFSTLVFKASFVLPIILVGINAAMIYYVSFIYQEDSKNSAYNISSLLGEEVSEAFLYGEIGILTYDSDYTINWMSELFYNRGIGRVSKKVTVWLPEVNALFTGDTDSVTVDIDEKIYEITRKDDSQILFFKDITKSSIIETKYSNERVVFGLIHIDNYGESTQYLEEQERSSINNHIRQPIIDWCKNNGMMLRRLKSDRFFVVLNESIFNTIAQNHFSILRDTRRNSAELDISITLSMAFSRGDDNLLKLDETVNSLLELAQSRGGDQVVIKKLNEEVKYYGGSSEATEKRSRVRVRIMANTLRNMVVNSSNVIICGHKEMDFDCVGAALCVSRIMNAYNRQTCIIGKTGGIEAKLSDALLLESDSLKDRHLFVTESEAINQLRDDTLVIMVDHHNPITSNGSNLLEKAKKIAIFDHHRRIADLKINPTLIYIEASASSTSELMAEFVPYLSNKINFNEAEATIMLAGMIIDTNRFTVRTGTRTFDAASLIRKWGADPILADSYLKDSYDEFELKNQIVSYSKIYYDNIVIVDVDEKIVPTRSLISQCADRILNAREIEAVFVISKLASNKYGISSRSKGEINVQIIMEAMNGGGHFSAAAVQRDNTSVEELRNELLNKIQEYLQEENK